MASVLLYTTAGHATNAGLYNNLSYDPVKDFTPITIVGKSSGFVLLVQADSPFKTIQDLMAAAKAKPDQISYGSFGNGNTTHIIGAMFARAANLKLIHVPYKSPLNGLSRRPREHGLHGHVDRDAAAQGRPRAGAGGFVGGTGPGSSRRAHLPRAGLQGRGRARLVRHSGAARHARRQAAGLVQADRRKRSSSRPTRTT
jgi:hypothetical protein